MGCIFGQRELLANNHLFLEMSFRRWRSDQLNEFSPFISVHTMNRVSKKGVSPIRTANEPVDKITTEAKTPKNKVDAIKKRVNADSPKMVIKEAPKIHRR